eukprot:CAMPEP_0171511756 /NCGR_PEP_ID=MMETSP0959-20130129/1179_1 /TAXON_ID=87120 /ORGANISM="Aurantiochytrium limacinum, Strain ATCCMYA-1381" /LENGTH=555 /DNA_ID=CAMNT_0012049433 /DNA_START=52 /DNA_END=1716 /DNA_ORIENTATION=+
MQSVQTPGSATRVDGEHTADLAVQVLRVLRHDQLTAAMESAIQKARECDVEGLASIVEEAAARVKTARLALGLPEHEYPSPLRNSLRAEHLRYNSGDGSDGSDSLSSEGNVIRFVESLFNNNDSIGSSNGSDMQSISVGNVEHVQNYEDQMNANNQNGNIDGNAVDEGSASISEAQFTAETVYDLLKPGHRFEGTIKIPVGREEEEAASLDPRQTFGGRTAYVVEILRSFKDEVGQQRFLVRHAAHGDEQVCVLTCQGDNSLAFNDFETLCQGVADPKELTLQGKVCQLQHGLEEFPIDGENGVHTFHLKLDQDAARCQALRAKLREELEIFSLTYSIYRVLDLERNMHNFERGWANFSYLPTDEVCSAFQDLMSTLNAMLLRQADLLDKLTFRSSQDKEETLKNLARHGLNRQENHATCDGLVKFTVMLLNSVLSWVSRRDPLKADIIRNRALHTQHRSSRSFDRFDRALRAAEMRVPLDHLELRQVSPKDLPSGANSTCCICLEELSNDTGILLPPICNHALHKNAQRGGTLFVILVRNAVESLYYLDRRCIL